MTQSGQVARRPPQAAAPVAGGGPTPRSRISPFDQKAAWPLVGAAALIHMLRDHRFWERLAAGGIAVVALARMGQENRASTMARLAAWNKRQVQFLEHQAEREAARLEHRAEREGKRLARKANAPPG